jgi:CYTH domain-containing protein
VAKKDQCAKGGIERERKFLIEKLPAGLSRYPRSRIEQGYLAFAQERDGTPEIRIRLIDRRFVLTAKKAHGEARSEHEIPLRSSHARLLWPLTKGRRVKKVRYKIPLGPLTIELDVYQANARGLAVAEVEFSSARAMRRFKPPGWFGREITGRKTFSNSHLATHGWKRKRTPKT